MIWPPRLTIRRLMLVVAVFSLLLLGARVAWERYRARPGPQLVGASVINAQATQESRLYAAGWPIPITVSYSFRIMRPLPPGTTVRAFVSSRVINFRTKDWIEGVRYEIPLKVGEREVASGAFTWIYSHEVAEGTWVVAELEYQGPKGRFERVAGLWGTGGPIGPQYDELSAPLNPIRGGVPR